MADEKNTENSNQGGNSQNQQQPPQNINPPQNPNPNVKPPDFQRVEKGFGNNIKK